VRAAGAVAAELGEHRDDMVAGNCARQALNFVTVTRAVAVCRRAWR
jgi:hypothetical protein